MELIFTDKRPDLKNGGYALARKKIFAPGVRKNVQLCLSEYPPMSSPTPPTPRHLWFHFARTLALLGFFASLWGTPLFAQSAQSIINLQFGTPFYTGTGVAGGGTFWNYFSGSSGGPQSVLLNSEFGHGNL
jgi:hypothetical protein